MSEMGAMSSAGKVLFRSHIVAIATAFLLNFSLGVSADVGAALQNSVDGRITRDGIDLFYKVVGPANGDYVLVLSGGPGEDIHSMEGIADELGEKYRCVMWEQRGTGRSKLPRYDSSTINLNAYMGRYRGTAQATARREIYRCRKLVGNDPGPRLCL